MIGPLTTTQAGAWCLMLAGVLGIGLMARRYRPARSVFGIAVLMVVASVLLPALTGCNGQVPGPPPSTDGTWDIGIKVGYGTYRTTAPGCRWKIGGDRPRSGRGPSTVYLGEHDAWITVKDCGVWSEVKR